MKKGLIWAALTACIARSLCPAWAAPEEAYVIDIKDGGASASRDVIVSYHNVGAGDMFLETVLVKNNTTARYDIALASIELLGDKSLAKKLSVALIGNKGETALSYEDFSKKNWPAFAESNKKDEGFQLKTLFGSMTNEYQGLSLNIRYTFVFTEIGRQLGGTGGNNEKKEDLLKTPNNGEKSGGTPLKKDRQGNQRRHGNSTNKRQNHSGDDGQLGNGANKVKKDESGKKPRTGDRSGNLIYGAILLIVSTLFFLIIRNYRTQKRGGQAE